MLNKLRPFVATADIEKIRRMSTAEKTALKEKINLYDLRNIFPADKQGKGFVCPNCGNGTGNSAKHKGDGIVPNEKNGKLIYHCFSCGNFEGDFYAILSKYNNTKEYCRILAIGQKILEQGGNQTFKSTARSEEISPAEKAIITADIKFAQEHLTELPVEERRGLTIETLKKFGCGYLASWIHPKHRLAEKQFPPSPRIIIPTSAESYDAILLKSARTEKTGKYKSMNAGRKNLFNRNALKVTSPVIIVEGEIDAMSIWQATGGKVNVVALGGTGTRDFLNFINDKEKSPTRGLILRLIVMFDNDNAGQTRAREFVKDLQSALNLAVSAELLQAEEKVDANDLLQKKGGYWLNNRIFEILRDNAKALNYGADCIRITPK